MQQYQFEKIFSQMEREFGKIKKGEEEAHSLILFTMESNALKIHRSDLKANSRRMREAIALVLYDIKGRYTKEEYDMSAFRNEDNGRLEKALLMAFDPFTNKEIEEVLGGQTDPDALREYYKEPIMCLLRIKDSIDLFEKRAGADGYFEFTEKYMGAQVHGSDMNFSVLKSVETV